MPSYEFNLNVDPGGMPPVIHLAQYDSARTYYANLKQDGVAYYTSLGTTAKIKGKNAFGVCWEQSCTIDSSHLDQVVFTPSGAATDQFGIMPVQMELTDTNGVISTLLMVWDIQKAGYTNEDAAASPEFATAIQAAVESYVQGYIPLVVKFEQNGTSYTSDKTWQEVAVVAANNQRPIWGYLGADRYWYSGATDTSVLFFHQYIGPDILVVEIMEIRATGTYKSTYEIPL